MEETWWFVSMGLRINSARQYACLFSIILQRCNRRVPSQNTNVIEIYSQLVKSSEQLTYYNSGIGTYAKPSWSWNYVKQAVDNVIDLAIAWWVLLPFLVLLLYYNVLPQEFRKNGHGRVPLAIGQLQGRRSYIPFW
jgi:hypothetical protein